MNVKLKKKKNTNNINLIFFEVFIAPGEIRYYSLLPTAHTRRRWESIINISKSGRANAFMVLVYIAERSVIINAAFYNYRFPVGAATPVPLSIPPSSSARSSPSSLLIHPLNSLSLSLMHNMINRQTHT